MDEKLSYDRTGFVRQRWVGSTDLYGMLGNVGSWQVGCDNAVEHHRAICQAVEEGLVQLRTHHGPAYGPEGVAAYELTDKGIEVYRWAYGSHAAARAETSRDWYRRGAASWEEMRCRYCREDFADHTALGHHQVNCVHRRA